jgi:CNT family concentrative nucleoside transporter
MLLGEKLVLTEFVAYLHLGALMNEAEPILSQRSAIISSYALCGFANFASIGIQIGGIGGIAPERLSEVASLGVRAMIGGTLAAFMTATIAGVLL